MLGLVFALARSGFIFKHRGKFKMKNLAFVIWMLGYPLVDMASIFLHCYLLNKVYTDQIKCVAAVVFLVTWIGVACLLYEK
jgi:hypothetical protein